MTPYLNFLFAPEIPDDDAGSKEESDSWVEVVSPNEVRMLDIEGKPIESDLNYSLKRS